MCKGSQKHVRENGLKMDYVYFLISTSAIEILLLLYTNSFHVDLGLLKVERFSTGAILKTRRIFLLLNKAANVEKFRA